MMNSIFKTAAYLALTCVAAPVAAQDMFSGGEVSVTFGDNITWDENGTTIAGSFVGDFGNIVTQLDVSHGDYGNTYYDAFNLHVGRELAPGTTVGVFYSNENWDDQYLFPIFGIELAYEADALAIDAAYGSYRGQSDISTEIWNFLMIEANYAIGQNIDIIGSFTSFGSDEPSLLGPMFGVGGRYTMEGGAFAELNAYRWNRENASTLDFIELRFGYEFGDGKIFGARQYNDQFIKF